MGIVPPIFLEVTVEDDDHLDFSGLNVAKHGGVLLDGVGDAMVLKKHREARSPKGVEGWPLADKERYRKWSKRW